MVPEIEIAEPAAADAGALRALTVRSGIGADAAVTTASKLLVSMLFAVLTSPFPRDGLILQITCISVVPTGNPLGSGNDTVCVTVAHRARAGTGARPRIDFWAGLLCRATEKSTTVAAADTSLRLVLE